MDDILDLLAQVRDAIQWSELDRALEYTDDVIHRCHLIGDTGQTEAQELRDRLAALTDENAKLRQTLKDVDSVLKYRSERIKEKE